MSSEYLDTVWCVKWRVSWHRLVCQVESILTLAGVSSLSSLLSAGSGTTWLRLVTQLWLRLPVLVRLSQSGPASSADNWTDTLHRHCMTTHSTLYFTLLSRWGSRPSQPAARGTGGHGTASPRPSARREWGRSTKVSTHHHRQSESNLIMKPMFYSDLCHIIKRENRSAVLKVFGQKIWG